MEKIICIVGPTACGKTALGTTLAQRFGGEVVSADSRMVYRGMEIGTAVPKGSLSTRPALAGLGRGVFLDVEGVPHHLIGVVDPDQPFTVVDWSNKAIAVVDDIVSRGKVPFVVGGTGLYISALVDNFKIPKGTMNLALRQKIESGIRNQESWVIQQLLELDPDAEGIVDLKNPRRVARALEVCLATGKPFTKQLKRGTPRYNALMIGIAVAKEELEERMRQRLKEQFAAGLLDEVKRLNGRYGCDIPPMQGFVYKELFQYLNGEISLEKAKELIILRSRQYAKRQMTWWKRDKRIQWAQKPEEIVPLVKHFLQAT